MERITKIDFVRRITERTSDFLGVAHSPISESVTKMMLACPYRVSEGRRVVRSTDRELKFSDGSILGLRNRDFYLFNFPNGTVLVVKDTQREHDLGIGCYYLLEN